MQRKKSQGTPRTTTGRVVSSSLTTPDMSLSAALRGRTEEQQQPQTHQVAVAGPATIEPRVPVALPQHENQTTSQSDRAPDIKSLPRDKMLKVAETVVEQIMTESNNAVLEEAKILAITKIFINLMEQNSH
jgi:hypothetical protein